MTQPPPIASLVSVPIEGAAPEVLAFLQFIATARALTPAHLALLTQYDALSPAHRTLVDDLLRELSRLSQSSTP
jgi:hypothetical protein